MPTALANANAASVAIIERGRVLLIRRARPPFRDAWTLPGGRREPGETIEATAIREVREELGVDLYGLVPVLEHDVGEGGAAWRLAVFATACPIGVPRPSDEVADWAWVPPSGLAGRTVTPGLDAVIARAFAVLALSP